MLAVDDGEFAGNPLCGPRLGKLSLMHKLFNSSRLSLGCGSTHSPQQYTEHPTTMNLMFLIPISLTISNIEPSA
jgi:hypothetical protein